MINLLASASSFGCTARFTRNGDWLDINTTRELESQAFFIRVSVPFARSFLSLHHAARGRAHRGYYPHKQHRVIAIILMASADTESAGNSSMRFEGLTEAQMSKVITYDSMCVIKAELERLQDENKILKRKLADQRSTIRVANEKEVDEKKKSSSSSAKSSSSKKEKKDDGDDGKKAKKHKKDKDEKKSSSPSVSREKESTKEEEDDDEKEKKRKAPPKCKICGELVKGKDHSACKEKRKEQQKDKPKNGVKEDGSESS
jgi:hypothetical protein